MESTKDIPNCSPNDDPPESKENESAPSLEDILALRKSFSESIREECMAGETHDIGDVKEENPPQTLVTSGCCHGDQGTEEVGAGHGTVEPEIIHMVSSSGSEEILELYKTPILEEEDRSFSPPKISALPPVSEEKPVGKLASKIPRGVESSQQLGPSHAFSNLRRGTTLSVSSLNLSILEGVRLKGTHSKTSNISISSSRKCSPRVMYGSVRGMEVELKALKKKFFAAQNEFEKNEKHLGGIITQIWALIERISEASGKERPLDDDLKGIRNFAAVKIGKRERKADIKFDTSLYESAFSEVGKMWHEVIVVILEYRKSMIKWMEGNKLLANKPEYYTETEIINKKVDATKAAVQEKLAGFLLKVEEQLKDLLQEKKNFEEQVKRSEGVMKEQEISIVALKREVGDLKAEMEKLMNKQKDETDKKSAEIMQKNKEIESLKEDNTRLQNMNKIMTKNSHNKEREYKESMALLNKQCAETCRREKEFEKKYEEIRDKLGNLQMRENNLKKKLFQSCQAEGGDASRTAQTREIQKLKAELKDAQEKLELMEQEREIEEMEKERKVLMEQEPYVEPLDLGVTTSADDAEKPPANVEPSEEVFALKKVIKKLHSKVRSLVTAKKEADLDIKQKIEDMMVWEKELSMREDRLYHQHSVVRMRNQLLTLLQSREQRRCHPTALSYEAICELLEIKKTEVQKLREKVRLLKEQDRRNQFLRVRLEQDNAYLSGELRGSDTPRAHRRGSFSPREITTRVSAMLNRKQPSENPNPSASRKSSRKSPSPKKAKCSSNKGTPPSSLSGRKSQSPVSRKSRSPCRKSRSRSPPRSRKCLTPRKTPRLSPVPEYSGGKSSPSNMGGRDSPQILSPRSSSLPSRRSPLPSKKK